VGLDESGQEILIITSQHGLRKKENLQRSKQPSRHLRLYLG